MYLMPLMNRFAWIVCRTWVPTPREPQSQRYLSQRPKRGLLAIPPLSMQVAVPNPKQPLQKGLDHPLLRQDDEEETQQHSRQLVLPHKGNTHPLFEPKGPLPSPERLENFANLLSGGTAPAAVPQQQPQKGTRLGNKQRLLTAMIRHW